MNAIYKFIICHLLGFSAMQYTAIAGTKLARNLAMRGIAIIIGSIAFGFGVFSFTRALLKYDVPPALLFSLVCAAVLFLIELNNIQDILATGQIGLKVVMTRVAVVGVMGISAVFAAIFPMEKDIAAFQARAMQGSAQQLERDSRFKVQLESVRAATDQASKDVVREKQLLTSLSGLNAKYANAKANATNELQGNTGADGLKRIEGAGARWRGFEAEAKRIDAERTSVSHELSALAGSSSRLTQAQGALEAVNKTISDEAAVLHGGASSRLGAMLSLMWSSGVALMVVAFYLCLSLLPEVLVLTALSKPGMHKTTLEQLNAVEVLTTEREIQRMRMALRDGLQLKPLIEGSAEDLGEKTRTATAQATQTQEAA